MADTKQATPELEVIVEEIWRHYNRGDTTDAVLTLKAALDSRSGPDRTAQESQKCAKCGKESPVAMCAANCDDMFCNRCIWDHETVCELTEAGPDRGQQDAPDYKDELHHAIYCRDAECLICFKIRGRFIAENVEAKAARVGQAPTGDGK